VTKWGSLQCNIRGFVFLTKICRFLPSGQAAGHGGGKICNGGDGLSTVCAFSASPRSESQVGLMPGDRTFILLPFSPR
jgi:hypothetical protein